MGRVGFVYISMLTLGERPLDTVVCELVFGAIRSIFQIWNVNTAMQRRLLRDV